ncbi:MAG TPA: BrnT family toxin [Rhizomicrobium sp.]|jgi:hypothetical protein
MLNIAAVTGFEWDDGNARKSTEKHQVGQADAEQIFFNEPLIVGTDEKHSETERRFHAIGHTDEGRLLHITFTLKRDGALIRVISAKPMSRKERARYDKI